MMERLNFRDMLGETWRYLRPRLEFLGRVILILVLYIIEVYRIQVDRLEVSVTRNMFPGHRRISRLYAHLLFWAIVLLTLCSISLFNVYFKWYCTLTEGEAEALLSLSVAFLGCAILLSAIIRSLRRRGIIRTILRAVGIILIIKCVTVLLAWTLTLNFGIDTPVLDNLITIIAKVPDAIIIQITQRFIPWIMNNIHILFG